MAPGCGRQVFEVVRVGRHDLVPVGGEQDHTGVNDVGEARGCQELSGGTTERLVEGADVDSLEGLGQPGLARAAAPHLAENPGMGEWEVTLELSSFEAHPHLPLVPLQCHQGAAVENEAHADFVVPVAC